ncbi:MAG: hypothetical protein R3D46_08475 [Defluviimonas denitrificans]
MARIRPTSLWRPISAPIWTSILFVQFLLALEDGFPGLEFSQETLVEASFDTIGSVAAFIATMTGAEAGGEAAAA